MSRIGKKKIQIPAGVELKIAGSTVSAKGPKGELEQEIRGHLEVVIDEADKSVEVKALKEDRETSAMQGLFRSLINNMVIGVSQGFERKMLLEGVGYRVAMIGKRLVFSVGLCHPVEFYIPKNVTITLDGNTKFKIESHDKQLLGQVAANIRSIRPPEPYKGKGIRYADEQIKLKVARAQGK